MIPAFCPLYAEQKKILQIISKKIPALCGGIWLFDYQVAVSGTDIHQTSGINIRVDTGFYLVHFEVVGIFFHHYRTVVCPNFRNHLFHGDPLLSYFYVSNPGSCPLSFIRRAEKNITNFLLCLSLIISFVVAIRFAFLFVYMPLTADYDKENEKNFY